MAQPDVRQKLTALGFEAMVNTSDEFADRIKADIPKWAKVVRAANIKAE